MAYDVFKIVGDKSRLNILKCIGLKRSGISVSEIVRCTKLEQSLVSHHLQKLREEGFVRSKAEGQQRIYTISDPRILFLIEKTADALRYVAREPLGITGEKKIEKQIKTGKLHSKEELLKEISSFEREFTLLFGETMARKMAVQMRKVVKEMFSKG
ncbi:MAG: metalloregulator ArsR/SmtB family transcription factor [Euryarchaeota archaeon]|nr:metalloregulator ArsR/SmtB family transcription factor [Euryarchaeota archaeon]